MKTARHQNEDETARFQTLAVLVSKTSLSYQRGVAADKTEAPHLAPRRSARKPEPLRRLVCRTFNRLGHQLADLIRPLRSSIAGLRKYRDAASGLSRSLSVLARLVWALKRFTSNRVSNRGGH